MVARKHASNLINLNLNASKPQLLNNAILHTWFIEKYIFCVNSAVQQRSILSMVLLQMTSLLSYSSILMHFFSILLDLASVFYRLPHHWLIFPTSVLSVHLMISIYIWYTFFCHLLLSLPVLQRSRGLQVYFLNLLNPTMVIGPQELVVSKSAMAWFSEFFVIVSTVLCVYSEQCFPLTLAEAIERDRVKEPCW